MIVNNEIKILHKLRDYDIIFKGLHFENDSFE